MKKSNKLKLAVAGAMAVGVSAANAASTIDTSSVTSAMTDASAAVAVVGAAGLVVIVGTKVFKWIARAL
ncbi:major capsid protein [Undibacterium terreum]|uniref:Bacteriophage coat protein B n=1 Tax=Undibacterium terreum TaxID=1224302 RepID=A0A916U3B3_9BURK|nr:major capsid protein [Undibacterium terreum]GGC57746.1 hypothetical protein GCM10011396_00750 [Undibacterium terreum]